MEKIRAFRVWEFYGDRLISLNRSPWPGPVKRAECPSGHRAPCVDGGCGIYSVKLPYTTNVAELLGELFGSRAWSVLAVFPKSLYEALIHPVAVFGYVDIWGKVIEHELGYRSEFAQIHTIFLPRGMWAPGFDGQREELMTRYGCEVIAFSLEEALPPLMWEPPRSWLEPCHRTDGA